MSTPSLISIGTLSTSKGKITVRAHGASVVILQKADCKDVLLFASRPEYWLMTGSKIEESVDNHNLVRLEQTKDDSDEYEVNPLELEEARLQGIRNRVPHHLEVHMPVSFRGRLSVVLQNRSSLRLPSWQGGTLGIVSTSGGEVVLGSLFALEEFRLDGMGTSESRFNIEQLDARTCEMRLVDSGTVRIAKLNTLLLTLSMEQAGTVAVEDGFAQDVTIESRKSDKVRLCGSFENVNCLDSSGRAQSPSEVVEIMAPKPQFEQQAE